MAHFDNRTSNPNSGGDLGLTGEMGVSSERTGPGGVDPRGSGIQGTGSRGGSVAGTDGELDTRPTEWDAVDVSRDDLAGHEDAATRETAVTDDTGTWQGIDHAAGTVAEQRSASSEDAKQRHDA